MTNHSLQHEYNNEIDLVKLLSNIWNEKITIAACIAIITILGLIYSSDIKPIFQASLQIEQPTTSQLSPLNNTQVISATPENAFSLLLSILESTDYKKALIETEKSLLAKLFNMPERNISIENIDINTLYDISYPNPEALENSLIPKYYHLKTQGVNRQLISQFLDKTLTLARTQLIERLKDEFNAIKAIKIQSIIHDSYLLTQSIKERRRNTIIQLTETTALQIKNAQDKLAARKAYVLDKRKNQITRLSEALKIAKALKIIQPSTLNRMSAPIDTTQKQLAVNTEINNQKKPEPLYLRGVNLLTIELESLSKLPKTTFLDEQILNLENSLLVLNNNREIEILKAREVEIAFNQTLQSHHEKLRILKQTQFPTLDINFKNGSAYSPIRPIKSKKTIILTSSILLGAIFGLLVATGRTIYKNRNHQKKDLQAKN